VANASADPCSSWAEQWDDPYASADLEMAVRAITFSAAGTCGQRCTTLRRLIVHNSLKRTVTDRLISVFAPEDRQSPRSRMLVGPLIDERINSIQRRSTLRRAPTPPFTAAARHSAAVSSALERLLRPTRHREIQG